jgi:hypothetical protein
MSSRSLEERVAELEATVRAMKAQAKGEPGRDGKDGRDGRDFRFDTAKFVQLVRSQRGAQIIVQPAPMPTLKVDAPVVHVAAPSVTVEAAAAPVVHAPVTVNVPKHDTVIRFEEDDNGNITGAALTHG